MLQPLTVVGMFAGARPSRSDGSVTSRRSDVYLGGGSAEGPGACLAARPLDATAGYRRLPPDAAGLAAGGNPG